MAGGYQEVLAPKSAPTGSTGIQNQPCTHLIVLLAYIPDSGTLKRLSIQNPVLWYWVKGGILKEKQGPGQMIFGGLLSCVVLVPRALYPLY